MLFILESLLRKNRNTGTSYTVENTVSDTLMVGPVRWLRT